MTRSALLGVRDLLSSLEQDPQEVVWATTAHRDRLVKRDCACWRYVAWQDDFALKRTWHRHATWAHVDELFDLCGKYVLLHSAAVPASDYLFAEKTYPVSRPGALLIRRRIDAVISGCTPLLPAYFLGREAVGRLARQAPPQQALRYRLLQVQAALRYLLTLRDEGVLTASQLLDGRQGWFVADTHGLGRPSATVAGWVSWLAPGLGLDHGCAGLSLDGDGVALQGAAVDEFFLTREATALDPALGQAYKQLLARYSGPALEQLAAESQQLLDSLDRLLVVPQPRPRLITDVSLVTYAGSA